MVTHTGIRAVGIGTILVVGCALVIAWASRNQRTGPAGLSAEPAGGRIEGGI